MTRRLVEVVSAWATLLCGSPDLASSEETAGYLLLYPPGARAIAMGKAQGVVAEDADAGYWNPATLAFIEPNHAASFTYSRLNGEFDASYPYVFAAYSERIERLHGVVAVSFGYLDFGRVETFFPPPGESHRQYELSPGVAYGGRISDALAIGIGFKVYRIDYSSPNDPPDFNTAANTVLFDAGVVWRVMDSRLVTSTSRSLVHTTPSLR